ncbi:MAG: DNA repair helicase XPB [Treponemataceae bacterium]
MQLENPLIIQSDKTLLLDVHSPRAKECRNALIPFAELERSPEHLHTYRLTPLSLWNACSVGIEPNQILETLNCFAKYEVPQVIKSWVLQTSQRFGKIVIKAIPDSYGKTQFCEIKNGDEKTDETKPECEFYDKIEYLMLKAENSLIYKELGSIKSIQKYLIPCEIENAFYILLTYRGSIKQELLKSGWPVKDEAPLREGTPLKIDLRENCLGGENFCLRPYQIEACNALVGDGKPGSGFGTIVLPCGSGKTIVGIGIMNRLQTNTLIVTTNISAVHQWIDELLDKTELTEEQIGEYTGEEKVIKPVTVATYQVLTWRPDKNSSFPHFQIFRENGWGLIIYDEVHLLPAPVFRVTAELQAVRRVGFTATLIREDGCENHVFSLVGPKRYDVPWKELENIGFIAKAECIEVRIDLDAKKEIEYAVSNQRDKYKIASNNKNKLFVVKELVNRFSQDKILVIGQYIEQLEKIAEELQVPIITGKTTNSQRDELYSKFRASEIRVLVVSKVANFAINLPDSSMAIQVSGTFGSRQEEAQRLGRILRPKDRTSRFFTLVTRNTVEEDFSANRQKFLTEQGYAYKLVRSIDEVFWN